MCILWLVGIVTVMIDGALSAAKPNLRSAKNLIEILNLHFVESIGNTPSIVKSLEVDLH